VAEQIREVDGVSAVSQARFGLAQLDGETAYFTALDAASFSMTMHVSFLSGDARGLQGDGILVDEKTADARGWKHGDTIDFLLPSGAERRLRVGGVFENNDGVGSLLVSMQTYEETGGLPLDRFVYVGLAGAADAAAVEDELAEVVSAYPVVDLKDQEEFKAEQRAQVDQMLMLINALLVLSVIIAVIGVVNTLVLSVIERTRELGLLRAIGMTQRQIRRMVRLESVVISVYGAFLGLVLGTVLGVSLTDALATQGIERTVVPWLELALFLLVGALIGVVAAALPARRAGRLKVLEAIATE
jgi:putative ABC transport system permease protein